MNGNRNGSMMQMQSRYGVTPQSDFTQISGVHRYDDDATVNPLSAESRTTVGSQMAWRGKLGAQSGQGTFLKFGDSSSPMMPPSVGA